MTVTTATSRIEYAGDGSTTAFSVPFYFLANGDLKVYQADTLKTITTHYTVTGAGNPAGGTVTFVAAPGSSDDVVIYRDPAITQSTDYVENDPFPAESHETALDRLTMIAQRSRDLLTRAVRLPDSEADAASMTLPEKASRLSHVIGFDTLGNLTTYTAQAGTSLIDLAASTGSDLIGFIQSGTGAVLRTALAKMRESVSVLDFGGDSTGVASSSAAITAAQTYLASIGGGTLYFPPGEYRVTTPIKMKPGVTYCGPMKAGLSSYNPNRSRIFSATGNIFTNAATAITEVAFRDLFIESESGGGHVFDWSSAGLVAKIEMSGVCLAQRNASKCVIYGVAAGGVFSLWLHDFEYVYVPACLYPPMWIATTTVNSIVIENFWSTSNGESAAGNPSIWIESTNAGGAAFNVTIRQGVFELPGSGSVIFKSVANSTIEDCTVYDLSIVPGYYQFAFMKGPSGPASNNCSIRRCRSTVGTAGFPDVFFDASVAGQGDFLIEQSTFSYIDGSASSQGCKVLLLDSSITNKANLPYLELSSGEKQVHFGATAGTSADVSFWNGWPGNRDGNLNIKVNGTHAGSISKTGVFSWGNAYILQTGVINAGAHMYPGTPAGAQQVDSGLLAGAGAPSNANGNDGDFYFRSDGSAGTSIYMKRAGSWVGIV